MKSPPHATAVHLQPVSVFLVGDPGKTRFSMDLSIGSSACHIAIDLVRKYSHLIVELYINDDKELFKKFFAAKNEIEAVLGVQADWRKLPQKKASRIMIIKDVDFDDKDQWPEQFE